MADYNLKKQRFSLLHLENLLHSKYINEKKYKKFVKI